MVPVAYESRPAAPGGSTRARRCHRSPGPGRPGRCPAHPPDAGFFGRDETLLALDRAFGTQPIVLLHGQAGIGKTAAAAEFGRWYQRTSGIPGPVLYTSLQPAPHVAALATPGERVRRGHWPRTAWPGSELPGKPARPGDQAAPAATAAAVDLGRPRTRSPGPATPPGRTPPTAGTARLPALRPGHQGEDAAHLPQ